ncbi:type II toxin-antitoxin system HipA family toxin [Sinorhizobium meliloti]|uniref:type II toxin-antitoxin system HipA family toxin n=1 Tax=Rhizobium meliloti TaxID=382 RepID=UPI0020911E87|nr:type II toxin-antitoxin system HipA family toxin [Sinorhizobium meliloti]MCO5965133.1 type II toxin-antitoxin system HipA family toxin [Sinorhizobium meliloti]
MALRSADILFKDESAGTLVETANGGTRFAYHSDWNEGNIACCFPSTQREHEWKAGLHPFFQHLGPEGWLREQQARSAHVVEEDDLGLLLRYGADCIGAVSIRPPDDAAQLPEIPEATASPGRTVSGVQKKLLVTKDDENRFVPASAKGSAPYIAKFNSDRIYNLVRNELLSLRWTAAVLGEREVTAFTTSLIAAVDETALIVTRFDRKPNGEKLRLEDCAQILSKPKGQDYAGKYDAAYEDIAAIIRQHSSRAPIDLLRFFNRLIVFTLIGNCDAHLKNFSLLETPTGLRLSPAYDVVNTAFYDGFDQTLALSIGGEKIHLEAANQAIFRAFGKEIGLPDRAIDQTFRQLKRQVEKAASIIRPPDAEPADGFVHRFKEIVDNSCLRILET